MWETPEFELVTLGKSGDQLAIAELFRRTYSSSLGVALRILRCGDESQDAVQAAYCSAFQHLAAFRGDVCFKTWITRIVMNCCFMQLRRRKRWASWASTDDPTGPAPMEKLRSKGCDPEQFVLRREIDSAFDSAIALLPESSKRVFKLYTFSGLSLAEVAAEMGLSLPAAKSRLFRARAAVRSTLKPVWSEVRVRDSHARARPVSDIRRRAMDVRH